jgi:hypothetical protein
MLDALDALFFFGHGARQTKFYFSLLNHLKFYYVNFPFILLFYKGVIE